MDRTPGTPRLLRELNDRAALEVLCTSGPLTRPQISELTGLSKVTASQVLSRLEERGLVIEVGRREGGPGPNAVLYGLNPLCGYVVGLEVDLEATTAALADITGRVLAEITVTTEGTQEPVEAVHAMVARIAHTARISMSQVQECVIGISALIDPATGDVGYCYEMPAWRAGVIRALRHKLRLPAVIDNDVNLAAIAERAVGATVDARSFVLVWIGRGPASAVMFGDQLLRGATGAAGEIGWLPVPGAPVGDGILDRSRGGVGAAFQTLVGRQAVQDLARSHKIMAGTVADVIGAVTSRTSAGVAFLDDLAARIAVGIASICTVLDPEVVVLGGDVGAAGGEELAARVQQAVPTMCLAAPRVVPSSIPDKPVLHGALHTAIDRAREHAFAGGHAQ